MSDRSFTRQLMSLQSNMLSFAYMLTSDRKSAHALVLDATLCALDREENYNEATSFKTWVFALMRNIFATDYKSRAHTAENSDSLYFLALDAEGEWPEHTCDATVLGDAINDMEQDMRVSFYMHLNGYSDSEIADLMYTPLRTIRLCIRKARNAVSGLFD